MVEDSTGTDDSPGAIGAGTSEVGRNEIPPPQCSAKGCRAAAGWQLLWNNPKIHAPERRKTWLACDEHRATLGSFLDARGFLREVAPHISSDGAVVS